MVTRCELVMIYNILGQVRMGAGQNRHRKKKTLLYLALIKKNSYAELMVLCLMVTHYIWNMIAFIAFLHCHYAYLSITITS